MKKLYLPGLAFNLLFAFTSLAQSRPGQTGLERIDSSHPLPTAFKNPPTVNPQAILPAIIFNEHPYNHNMHITSDGTFYYTINGGNSGNGQINKFDLTGALIQTYPIQIDGRGLSYNLADSSLYASLYAGDIVKINDLSTGTFTTKFTAIMHDGQASFAISPDGTKFYDFASGTLYVHDFVSGAVIDTLTNLSFGAGNFGGNAAVAVDSNYIYTWDATLKTVYIYDQLGALTQTFPLDSGDNGHSLSVTNNYLFVSRDGNYSIGTWYGYPLTPTSNIPVANFTSTAASFCEKQCIDFFDLTTNSPTSWQWYFPNASPDTSTLQNPVNICFNNYGTYDVALVACNGVACDSLFLPGFITVFQSPPAPAISQIQDTLFSSTAYSYAWYEGSNASQVLSTDSFFVVTQNGNYFVIITDSNGCASSSNVVLINTGIWHVQGADNDWVSYYSNPATDMIHFSFQEPFSHAGLKIYNVLGEIILQSSMHDHESSVNLSSLKKGIYLIQMDSENKHRTFKFAKKN